MENTKPSTLRRQAKQLLQGVNYDSKKLVLIYTAATLGGSILVTLLNYILSLYIEGTGGLSGMTTRAILTTAQYVLELATTVALLFLPFGLKNAALGWARGKTPMPRDLWAGFRSWSKVLGLGIAKAFACFAPILIAFYFIRIFLFVFAPFFPSIMALMEAMPVSVSTITEAELETLTELIMPVFIAFCAICIPLILFLSYLLRFADFALMAGKHPVESLLYSLRITFKNFGKLVKLDLSLWWFYLLQALCAAIMYADTILRNLQISLPISPEASFFLFYLLGTLCQGILLWQCQGKVTTSYALLYDAIGDDPDE